MPRKRNRSDKADESRRRAQIESESLEPLRVVERVLTHPDGTTMKVKVPVYPPFQLKKRVPAKQAGNGKVRKAS